MKWTTRRLHHFPSFVINLWLPMHRLRLLLNYVRHSMMLVSVLLDANAYRTEYQIKQWSTPSMPKIRIMYMISATPTQRKEEQNGNSIILFTFCGLWPTSMHFNSNAFGELFRTVSNIVTKLSNVVTKRTIRPGTISGTTMKPSTHNKIRINNNYNKEREREEKGLKPTAPWHGHK